MLERLVLGSTLNYPTTVVGYSAADSWILKYRLIPRTSGAAITITCITDPDDATGFRAQVTAATTAAWTAGSYNWASWVEKAAEKYDVDTGSIILVGDPRTVTAPYDLRTTAEKALEDAKAAMAAWSPTTMRYKIGDREMWFSTRADIVGVVSYWQVEVNREQRKKRLALGLPDPRNTYVRLNRE
jgi:hypothetical protein